MKITQMEEVRDRLVVLGCIRKFQPIDIQELYKGTKDTIKTSFFGIMENLVDRDLVELKDDKWILTSIGEAKVGPLLKLMDIKEV